MADQLATREREAKMIPEAKKEIKLIHLLGMSQQRLGAANAAREQAKTKHNSLV